MPSTYSPDLRIQLMANGENSGTWGTVTNTNLGTLLEDAISGLVTVDIGPGTSQAFTVLDGLADQSRNAAIRVTSALSSALSVYVPPVTKQYTFINATNATGAGTTVTVYASTVSGNTTAAGTGVAVPVGASVLLRCDGTNVVEQLNTIVGNLAVNGTLTTSGSPSFNGNLTVANSAFLGNSQVATASIANPTVITVAASPVSNAAVVFTTTGTLPTGLTVGTLYYVSRINATTFNVSTSSTLSPLVEVTAAGSGVHTVSTVPLAVTPPQASNSTQLATTAFVKTATSNIPVTLTNWALSETNTAQVATMTIATPAVVTVTTAPANGTAVAFTTTGALPTGVTAGTPYYVFNRTSSTYNLATTSGQSQTATFASTTASTFTVTAAPTNGQIVYLTGTVPSGLTAGVNYFVVGRTTTTFQVSLTSGGAAIAFTSTGSCIATWQSLVATTGTQSGVHTENTSKLYFAYKSVNRMSIDLGGNTIASGNVTAFGTP